MKRLLIQAAWPLAVLVAVITAWDLCCRGFAIPAYVLPPPSAVLRVILERHQTLWNAFRITAIEAGGGYLLSIIGGVVIALFFAQSPLVRRSFYPYTILLQTVPIVAIAPLILMWFGSGLRSVMLVAFVICLFPIIANTTQGLISVPRNLIDLFVGLRISAGISVIGAVTGELFASSNAVGEGGLGYSITYANSQLQTDYLFALVLTASLLGFLFFFTVTALEWLCLRKWHESAMKTDAD